MRTPPGLSYRPHASLTLISVLLIAVCLFSKCIDALSNAELAALRKESEDLFYHGYENYMTHAFPEDEVRPLTCRPLTRDRENPGHFEINDALGNYSLTLIDSLSTLAVLASSPSNKKRNKPLLLFQDGVQRIVEQYGDGTNGTRGYGLRAKGFDLDSKVQVFETAIRGVGGLLSAHLFAVGDLPIRGYSSHAAQARDGSAWYSARSSPGQGIKWNNGLKYDGQLLRLAHDLARRLLPAFWTETGIPYPRVNLRQGIPFYANSPRNFDPIEGQCSTSRQSTTSERTETCSAGAGSLVVEFTVLSRLTGDPRFEELAKRAFWAVWNRRSDVGLVGAGIDAETGIWLGGDTTGIGAGIDSFYEYAFKSYVLLSQQAQPKLLDIDQSHDPRMLFGPLEKQAHTADDFYHAWVEAQAAVKRHVYRDSGSRHPHYVQVNRDTGASRGFWIDALSAFYPGLLAQAGHIEEAVETHLLQTALWTRFSAIPERWNLFTGAIEGGLAWWVGRPEFIESNYHIYRATEDPWYLHVAEMTLRDIKRRCWAQCGWTSIQDVRTGEQADRMESFFLGETAKYLFLTFDPDHPLNHLDGPMVFNTEGHPLIIPSNVGRDEIPTSIPSDAEPGFCPAKPKPLPFSISWTAARKDVYRAAALAQLHLMPTRDNIDSPLGEYATDHPSINIADLSSPSNYTYYPWTLPPALVPFNATTGMMPTKTFDISFPTMSNTASQSAPPVQRVAGGILINHIGGLKLNMVQDMPEQDGGDAYRIQIINNIFLGRDEQVYLPREADSGVLSMQDPYFTRMRDTIMLDLVVQSAQESEVNNSAEATIAKVDVTNLFDAADSGVKSAWSAIVSQLSSLIKDPPFSISMSGSDVQQHIISSGSLNESPTSRHHLRHLIPAITATGLGAAAIPDWPDAYLSSSHPNPNILPWSKIYIPPDEHANLCDHRLDPSIPRNHQAILIKRGGCSFSQKLRNIPPSPASPLSLQLVVMVSYGNDEAGAAAASHPRTTTAEDGRIGELDSRNDIMLDANTLIRPLLEEAQLTTTGLARHNGGIPLVMVGGGAVMWERLSKAEGLGVRRRWEVKCAGVRIGNLVIT